ncbi:unnamed protein product [Larinioides sclopetarius]|uniref:Uncharacterized protein n=1 Tax=Larinioides sclopetarius TaxID=280406 RepID=A0AAV1YTE3_9ARAC
MMISHMKNRMRYRKRPRLAASGMSTKKCWEGNGKMNRKFSKHESSASKACALNLHYSQGNNSEKSVILYLGKLDNDHRVSTFQSPLHQQVKAHEGSQSSSSSGAGNCLVHTERVELGFKSPMNASGSDRKRIFKYVIIGSESYALLSLPALDAFQEGERSKHEITGDFSE